MSKMSSMCGYFDQRIFFLEKKDFEQNGKLKPNLKGKYLLIMVGGSFCHHCKTTAPEFNEFTRCVTTEKLNVVSGFVQIDGEEEEKALGRLFRDLYDIRGIPTFILYGPDGNMVKITYEDRTRDELKNFIMNNVR